MTSAISDYAIGVEPYNMFFTVAESTNGFKFYGNATNCTTISGTGNIATAGSMASASAQITNNCTVGGNLTVTGSLLTTSFYASKPYIGFYCINNLLSGTVFLVFVQSGTTLSRTVAGTYTFTIPTHPKGANYMVFVQQQATASTSAIAI